MRGATGQIVEVFCHERGMVIFSVQLMSGTMVMVHPVSYGGDTFLPCVYGYASTVHRTQEPTWCHGALYLDGRVTAMGDTTGRALAEAVRSRTSLQSFTPGRDAPR